VTAADRPIAPAELVDADGVNVERPSRFIVHISDTHLVDDGALLQGVVDSAANVQAVLDQLEEARFRPDAILVTGDLADTGLASAYRRLRGQIEGAAGRLGAQVIWVMGNHDSRENFRHGLLDEQPSDAPVDAVHWIGGLRVVVLDTTVPGSHWGVVTDDQLAWLGDVLAEPAPEGTLLAMHHPPMPDPVYAAQGIELRHQAAIEAVVAGSDVRCILAGHLHYSTNTTFAGIPLSVAAATCYTNSVTEQPGSQRGMNGGQSINLVHVYARTVVNTIMPVAKYPTMYQVDGELLAMFNSLPVERQHEVLLMSNEERLALAARMRAEAAAAGAATASGS
jgi:3',5'-cyclic-AMP phosphodiesterase